MINKFLTFCAEQKFQRNKEQIKTLELLVKFYKNESFLEKILSKFISLSICDLFFDWFGLYLAENVGVNMDEKKFVVFLLKGYFTS